MLIDRERRSSQAPPFQGGVPMTWFTFISYRNIPFVLLGKFTKNTVSVDIKLPKVAHLYALC